MGNMHTCVFLVGKCSATDTPTCVLSLLLEDMNVQYPITKEPETISSGDRCGRLLSAQDWVKATPSETASGSKPPGLDTA